MFEGQFSGIIDAIGFILAATILLGFPFLALFYAAWVFVTRGGLYSQPIDRTQPTQSQLPVAAPPQLPVDERTLPEQARPKKAA